MKKKSNYIGKNVIVRGDRSGVFCGTLTARKDSECTLSKVRKLWYWEGASAVEQLAVDGVSEPMNCKFTIVVDELIMTDAIQILPCSDKSYQIIMAVKEWKM